MRSRMTLKNSSEDSNMTTDDNRVNPFELATLLIAKRKTLVRATLGVMILTALVVLLIPNQYESVATLLPSGPTDRMADLKSLAGLGSFSQTDENSSELFPTILNSQSIRDAVLDTRFDFTDDDEQISLTLTEYFEQDNRDKLRRSLAGITSIGTDKKTGVITLAVETDYPEFSRAILTKYISELESFNMHKRKSRAKENAVYLTREVEKRKSELARAEDSLSVFQEVNRDWANSTDPYTFKTMARFKRSLEIQSQTLAYMTGELEVAKMDAQKDVPIVQILDKPTLPIMKSRPARTATVLIAGVATFIFMLFFVVIAEAARRASRREGQAAFDEMTGEATRAFPRTTRVVNRLKQRTKETSGTV